MNVNNCEASDQAIDIRYRATIIGITLPLIALVLLLSIGHYVVWQDLIRSWSTGSDTVITSTQLQSLLAWQLIYYVVLLLAIGATALLAQRLLRQKFIIPVQQIVRFLQQACNQQSPNPPPLPERWKATMAIIAQCFQAHQTALQQLQAGEAFKRAVVDSSILAVIAMNQQGKIIEINHAAEHIFGFQAEQMLGQDLADKIIPERYRAAHRAGLQRHLLTGQAKAIGINLELNALHANGLEFPIELTIFVTPIDGGVSYTAFIADHTLRRQAEEQVAQQREALVQSEKLSSMGALLAGVAHELNNPLAILMGRAALLEEKAKDSAVQADAERIRIAAERCGRIVKTFLSMARQKPVERKWSSLNDVAMGAADLLNYSLRSSGIKLTMVLDEALPNVEIDADKIGQVLVNLIINAQQALSSITKNRQLRIQTGIHNNFQFLQLIDNGLGVPEIIKERIFEPFFTTKVEGIGTGIGLSVSRAILREHGGELVLEASAVGASFLMTLPLQEPKYKIRFQRTANQTREIQHEGTVLIVDDEHEVAVVLAEVLGSAGYDVYIANSGNDALLWLASNHCDLLFSDVRMPDMDGITLWKKLQKNYPNLIKHMAFITGDTLSTSIAPLIAETGLPYLEKPFSPEDVLQLAARIELG